MDFTDAPDQLRGGAEEEAPAWGDSSSPSSMNRMPWGGEYPGTAPVDMDLVEMATHGHRSVDGR